MSEEVDERDDDFEDEEEEEEDFEEELDDFEDLDDPLEDDDFVAFDDDEEEPPPEAAEPAPRRRKRNDDDLTPADSEMVAKANPKRLKQARRKSRAIVEGIITDAELSNPEGQTNAWAKLQDKTDSSLAKAYAIDADISENDVVSHARFGIGFVLQRLTPTKIEVLFEDGLRKLVCNQQR